MDRGVVRGIGGVRGDRLKVTAVIATEREGQRVVRGGGNGEWIGDLESVCLSVVVTSARLPMTRTLLGLPTAMVCAPRVTVTFAHVRELAKCRVWRMASETPSLWARG